MCFFTNREDNAIYHEGLCNNYKKIENRLEISSFQ